MLKHWGCALKFYLATLVSILALTAGANAADAVVEEVPAAVEVDAFTWSGFYAGIHGGYGWADSEINVLSGGLNHTSEADLDGFLVGVHAGAQHQFGNNIVLGVEFDVDYRDGDGTGETFAGAFAFPGFSSQVEYNWTGSARLRAGYAMDRWLPYVTGGLAFADFDAASLFNGAEIRSYSDTSVGWTAGLGTEYAFTDNLIFRAEYRYSDFGNSDGFLLLLPTTGDLDLTSHDINLGVSYKF
ncbi:MAG: porin family protein [Mesorhizobium sp.]|nr:MAG: porin family protein [Mesorhizobium sp.]RWB13820.1 MAG: porin family protein [Mesorhizobium sp.]